MLRKTLARRRFLKIVSGVIPLAVLSPLRAAAKFPQWRIYRCSVRGRRASRATKSYCANLRFKNYGTALKHPRPHPGDDVRIVKLDVSMDEYFKLFVSRRARAIDLRTL